MEICNDPNLLLKEMIADQNITSTAVIIIATTGDGGVQNIPFVKQNVNVVQMTAIFWIETVQNPDGSTYQQLQYTQTITLNFLGINWPHVSVATLIKQ